MTSWTSSLSSSSTALLDLARFLDNFSKLQSYFNIILKFFIWKKLEINIFSLQSFVFIVSWNCFGQIRRKVELFYQKLCSFRLEHQLAWVLDQLIWRSQASDALYLDNIQKSMVIFVHVINFIISFKTL